MSSVLDWADTCKKKKYIHNTYTYLYTCVCNYIHMNNHYHHHHELHDFLMQLADAAFSTLFITLDGLVANERIKVNAFRVELGKTDVTNQGEVVDLHRHPKNGNY